MNNIFISCVVPARNEVGLLREVISQIKLISAIQDIIIIEGGSSDTTWDVSLELAQQDPMRIRAFQQSGKGKFNAVQHGAANAKFLSTRVGCGRDGSTRMHHESYRSRNRIWACNNGRSIAW